MTIQCPAFDLPDSPLISETSQQLLAAHRARIKALMAQAPQASPAPGTDDSDPQHTERQNFYRSEPYKSVIERYQVAISLEQLGGVPVEIFTPGEGIAKNKQAQVLINIHGGGFVGGSQTLSRMESIPIAALGGIKVISIDYRLAPEHRFPAASDDAVAVYRAVLKDYAPSNIGVYGSSAGAYIAAQLMVQLQQQGLALPAALGMIAGGAFRKTGDSMAMGGAIVKAAYGFDLSASKDEYFIGANTEDPQVTPGLSDTLMANFPPAFLASSTRDYLLSAVVATHRKLLRLGREADLHIWEGLEHIFHCNTPDLPETEELHRLTVAFFNQHLGQSIQHTTGAQ